MRIVLDTNIFLVSISRKSPFHWIFQNLLEGKYRLCLTNEILLEYEEILDRHMGKELSENVHKLLMESPNVDFVKVYFKWNLLKDEDDNKFVECYLSSESKYIVSHDKGFKPLLAVGFLEIKVISASEFRTILEEL